MTDQYKRLWALLFGSTMALVLAGWFFDDYMHARRFVRYGEEKQATILELDRVLYGRFANQYVYALQIDHTTLLKKFPYNWTLPIKRSFLVMSDSPRPNDIALGNHGSSALTILCYMEGCDIPGNLLLTALALLVSWVMIPILWIRLIKTWEAS